MQSDAEKTLGDSEFQWTRFHENSPIVTRTETNIAPENKLGSKKESSLRSTNFQGLCYFPGG